MARYLDHTRNSTKNQIEQRTIDDYKATPLLMAALGGNIDLVELLIKNKADISAKLDFRGVKHGLVEVAMIREDMLLLDLAFRYCPDASKRILTLIGLEKLDVESRGSVGRVLHKLSQEISSKNTKE